MGFPSSTAKTVFLEALEIASCQERQALLDARCGTDAELRREVDELLAHHEQVHGFLETPPTDVADLADTARESHAIAALTLSFLSPSQRPGSLGRLGHYEILEVIGSGGFGVVLKAHDEKLQRIVAIKSLAESLAASATARRRFVREAQNAAAVRHDNVVGIFAVEDGGPVPYLVMELVDGISLEEKLRREGPLELKEVLRIGLQIADGLSAAHKQGLVHRDVKPTNILLENGIQRVKITDFGLARGVDDVSLTQTGMIAGTPAYMSPEQARGERVDARSDLFSLGSVLYALCTGQVPFQAGSSLGVAKKVCEETPQPIAQLNPAIPPWLSEIVERLHAKDPARRFQSAEEVAGLLGNYLAQVQQASMGLPVIVTPHRSQKARELKRRWQPSPGVRRWLAVVAVAVMLMGATLGFTEARGVTQLAATIIRIFTPKGTLVVEVDDPRVKVTVEGDGGLVITGAGLHEVHLKPGQYQLRADKDGQPVPLNQELITITRGEKQVVGVRLESPATAKPEAAVPASEMKARQELYASRLGVSVEITNSVGMRLRLVPPGEFLLGTTEDEVAEVCKRLEAQGELAFMIDAARTEHRPRPVVIAEPFYAGACEVTVGQFKRFVSECDYRTDGERANVGGFGDGPGGWARRPEHQWRTPGGWEPSDDQPVVQVSWDDARAFCAWLGKREGRTYTLPTEAQWEYAARAGTTARYGEGGDLVALDAVGWVRSNRPAARPGPQPVAQKRPNALGLYDTHGNVWEWCADPFKEGDRRRAIRGGAWYLSADHARIGSRGSHEPDRASDAGTGFRVVLVGDLRSSRSADPALPFVVLNPDGRASQNFDTLAEAVLKSSDGDTIEIRGNGPFGTAPINLSSRRTIRAGQGFRPVVKPDLVAQSGRMATFLESRAPLVLEGLEIQADASSEVLAVNSLFAPLYVANCRFIRCMLAVENHPACQLRNSQFSNQSYAVRCIRGSTAVLDNNILANSSGLAPPLGLLWPESIQRMEITRNVITGGNSGFVVNLGSPRGSKTAGAAQWHLAHNLVSGAGGILRCNQSITQYDSWTAPLEAAELERQLRERISWHEEQNLYSTVAPLLSLSSTQRGPMTPIEPTNAIKTLAEWNRFWGQSDTRSMQGTARFQAGDAVYTTPHILAADDFRLRSDSAGHGAGPDGKDLGPDIDLVGPGAPYERWKMMPEYQEWLQETGQLTK